MAIVEMNKIELIAMQEDKRKLIRSLSKLGVTQIVDFTEDEMDDATKSLLSKHENLSEISELETRIKDTKRAMDTLSKYSTRKKGLFAQRREVEAAEYDEALASLEKKPPIYTPVNQAASRISVRENEKTTLQNQIDSLRVWENMNIPLETKGTRTMVFVYGSIDVRFSLEEVKQAFDHITEANYLCETAKDTNNHYVYVLYHKKYADDCEKVLQQYNFNRIRFTNLSGTAHDNIVRDQKRLEEIEKEIEKEKAFFAEESTNLDQYELYYDALLYQRDMRKAESCAAYTRDTVLLQGWLPKENAQTVKTYLERQLGVVATISEPKDDEEYPVLLHNPKLVEPFEAITEMYSLPRSRSGLDPNKVMGFFYFLLFGMMVSDAAYGLIVMLICGAIILWKKPEGQMGKLIKVIWYGGLSTFVWGALFGSWFGDLVDKWTNGAVSVPMWFSPLEDPMRLLVISCAIGLVHLMVGMGMKGYMLIRRGKIWDAVFDIGFWYLVFIGAVCILLSMTGIWPVSMNVGVGIAIAGAIGLVLTQGRAEKNPLMKLGKGILSLYDITSYLSDVLSYSRLLAMGLSTAVVASVVNTLGLLGGKSVQGLILFAFVFIVGHIFNMAINLLGAYVHTSRLQYVEFFGKFYEDGGKPFKPLRISGKYTKIKSEQ